jgi:Na+-transporting methylmalonyl-CoA/oxaloacetate decarboxylase gamma subunit
MKLARLLLQAAILPFLGIGLALVYISALICVLCSDVSAWGRP